jgi:hypothetical protein
VVQKGKGACDYKAPRWDGDVMEKQSFGGRNAGKILLGRRR